MNMTRMDALMKYWTDPETTIIPAGETDQIIAWLGQQDADTWHKVVLTWNYDHGDRVLNWILDQEACDRGTAARVFMVEGMGNWGDHVLQIDIAVFEGDPLCGKVLRNWPTYQSAELGHGSHIPDGALERGDAAGRFKGHVIDDVLHHAGTREAVSQFASEDGKIVIDFDHWLDRQGITLTD